MIMRLALFLLSIAALLPAAAYAALPITVSLESEASGIHDSTSGFLFKGVERFENQPDGFGNFTTGFNSGGAFSGTYTGVQVLNADQYGGAGGNGKYAVTFSSNGYSLDLSSTRPGGVTYFGFWLSALDRGNSVTFYSGGSRLFTFNAVDAKTFVNGLPGASSYYSNPNTPYRGQNGGEPYAFLNFYAKAGTSFDKIVFAETPQAGGYESDNHTVGQWKTPSGTIIPNAGAVPEPESWALMIAGFAMVGAAMRRRSKIAIAA